MTAVTHSICFILRISIIQKSYFDRKNWIAHAAMRA